MIRKLCLAAIFMAAAPPGLAQNAPPSSPYAPLVDRPTCSRDELKAASAAYVAAQRAGNLAGLNLDPKARFLENMKDVDRAAGLWAKALPIAQSASYHDDKRCKTFTEFVVNQGPSQYIVGTRLYLHQGRIIRVDSIVTKPGDWLFNANSFLRFARADVWQPPLKYQHTPASEMIRGANAYLDAFSDKFTDIPWGQPCGRLEGGMYTNRDNKPDASCEVGIPAGVLYIVNRDYLVDEEMGVINVFCRFGSSTGGPDSHTFRFIDGRIRGVHTLSALPGPQADDNGGMVRAAAPAAAPPRS